MFLEGDWCIKRTSGWKQKSSVFGIIVIGARAFLRRHSKLNPVGGNNPWYCNSNSLNV